MASSCSSDSARENGSCAISIAPPPMWFMFRMLLMSPSRCCPLWPIFSSLSRVSGASSPLRRAALSSPRITFIGVRISWLMLARKRDLARSASSAASSLASSCSFARMRRVMPLSSRYMMKTKMLPPKRIPAMMRSGLPKMPTTR